MGELTVLNNNYSFRVAASHNGFQTSLTLSKTRFFCRKVNVPFGGVDFVYRQLQSQNPSGKSYPVRMEMPMRYVSIHAVRIVNTTTCMLSYISMQGLKMRKVLRET